MTFARILAIVDGSDSSAGSLQTGLQLGRRFSCRVDFLHVEPDVVTSVPIVVNRYVIYDLDIRPKGFRCLELDGYVTEELVQETRALLDDADRRREWIDTNFALGKRHYSHKVLSSTYRTRRPSLWTVPMTIRWSCRCVPMVRSFSTSGCRTPTMRGRASRRSR